MVSGAILCLVVLQLMIFPVTFQAHCAPEWTRVQARAGRSLSASRGDGGKFLASATPIGGHQMAYWAVSLARHPLTGHVVHRDRGLNLQPALELQDTRRLPRIVFAYRWQWILLRRRLGSHAPEVRCRLQRYSAQTHPSKWGCGASVSSSGRAAGHFALCDDKGA